MQYDGKSQASLQGAFCINNPTICMVKQLKPLAEHGSVQQTKSSLVEVSKETTIASFIRSKSTDDDSLPFAGGVNNNSAIQINNGTTLAISIITPID